MGKKNKIILYHGTISDFKTINLNKCQPFSDFGKGFYTAINKKQGINMAERRRQANYRKYKNLTQMRLYVYELADHLQSISVKRFRGADIDWVEFVLSNRRCETFSHNYDLVIGPTADDQTNDVLDVYLIGGYGKVGSISALETLLKQLEPQNLRIQYCFISDKSISLLKLKEVILL